MPVLNGGNYLHLSVTSIVRQSFRDWELLLFDDGSTDSSVEQLRCLDDPRIKVIKDGKTRGIAERLNQAIDMARGDFFARMDHDDISHPDRFQQQVEFLQTHPEVDLLATKCLTIDEMDRVTGKLPFAPSHKKICSRPWFGFPMAHPSWMGRTSWFKRYRYRDPAPYWAEVCCEDSELLMRAYKSSLFHCTELPLLAYRVRSHTPWLKKWRTRKAMAAMQIEYFISVGDWRSVLLVGMVRCLRVLLDLKDEAVFQLGLKKSPNYSAACGSQADETDWIAKLKLQALSSANAFTIGPHGSLVEQRGRPVRG